MSGETSNNYILTFSIRNVGKISIKLCEGAAYSKS